MINHPQLLVSWYYVVKIHEPSPKSPCLCFVFMVYTYIPSQMVANWWFQPTPLKNMKVSWDDEIPNIWKDNPVMFQSPPTRDY